MSRCHGSVPQDVRPGTARVLVTELSSSGHINPTPVMRACDNPEAVEPFYLSPERLVGLAECRRMLIPLMYPFVTCLRLIHMVSLIHTRLSLSKPLLSDLPFHLIYSSDRNIYVTNSMLPVKTVVKRSH